MKVTNLATCVPAQVSDVNRGIFGGSYTSTSNTFGNFLTLHPRTQGILRWWQGERWGRRGVGGAEVG